MTYCAIASLAAGGECTAPRESIRERSRLGVHATIKAITWLARSGFLESAPDPEFRSGRRLRLVEQRRRAR
jgi:hypothetical protein